jgi:pilus assembly protein CpaB
VAVSVLSPAQALRQPRRLNVRALVGVFLMLAFFTGSMAYWTATSDTKAVLVATRDLPVGAPLQPSDLAVARVRLDDGLYAAALPADEQTSLIGRQLAYPVLANQLLVRAQLSPRPLIGPDQVALTIPVGAQTAAGGRIKPGDAVRVYLTTDKGKPESRTTVVLDRVTVYDVGYEARTAVVNTAAADRNAGGALSSLTLVVSAEQAAQVAHARWNGELDVALLPAA